MRTTTRSSVGMIAPLATAEPFKLRPADQPTFCCVFSPAASRYASTVDPYRPELLPLPENRTSRTLPRRPGSSSVQRLDASVYLVNLKNARDPNVTPVLVAIEIVLQEFW